MCRGEAEWDVHTATVSLVDRVGVKTLSAVYVAIEQLTALFCQFLIMRETALIEHMSNVQRAHMYGPCGWSVMKLLGCMHEGFPVAENGRVGTLQFTNE